MGAYQDYVATHVQSSKPYCFGETEHYDETDSECAHNCAWRKECRPLVVRKKLQESRASAGGTMMSRGPIRPSGKSTGIGRRKYGTLELAAGESPWGRLAREMAASALSSAGEEFAIFFKQYRFPYVPPPQLQMKCDCGTAITLNSAFCSGCGSSLK